MFSLILCDTWFTKMFVLQDHLDHQRQKRRQQLLDAQRELLKKKLDVKIMQAQAAAQEKKKTTASSSNCQFGSAVVQEEILNYLKQTSAEPVDGVTNFLLSLADDLRSIPQIARIEAQIEIQNVILKAVTNNVKPPSCVSSALELSREMQVSALKPSERGTGVMNFQEEENLINHVHYLLSRE